MRYMVILCLVLAACDSGNRADGVSSSEAAGLNAAATKLDADAEKRADR